MTAWRKPVLVATVAALLAASAGYGLVASVENAPATTADAPTSATSLRAAAASWNWTGFSADRSIPLRDQGWVHIAIPLDKQTEITGDRTVCMGPRNGSGPRWIGRQSWASNSKYVGWTSGPSDGEWGASATVGSEHREVQVSDPTSENGGCRRVEHLWRDEAPGVAPIYHYVLAWGNMDLKPRSYWNISVRNSVVLVAQGDGQQDTWEYTPQDFQGDASVYIDYGHGRRAATASRLDADLLRGHDHAAWWWNLPRISSEGGVQVDNASIVRPNGSVIHPWDPAMEVSSYAEVTGQAGEWTFNIPERVSNSASHPVVIGASIDMARPAWLDRPYQLCPAALPWFQC